MTKGPIHATNEKINALSQRFEKVETLAGHKLYATVLTSKGGRVYARFYGKDIHESVDNAMAVLNDSGEVAELLARKENLINELKVKNSDLSDELEALKHGPPEKPANASNPVRMGRTAKKTRGSATPV